MTTLPDSAPPTPIVPWLEGPGHPDIREWLAGPRSRRSELARLARIFAEFLRGFRARQCVAPCVTMVGPARVAADVPQYTLARPIG